jgi:hypothetical protein
LRPMRAIRQSFSPSAISARRSRALPRNIANNVFRA